MHYVFYGKTIVEMRDKDSMLLDAKKVDFKTEEGCIYCPAGQCNCAVSMNIVPIILIVSFPTSVKVKTQ